MIADSATCSAVTAFSWSAARARRVSGPLTDNAVMHAKNIKTKRVKLYLLIYGVDCPTEAGRFERRIVTQALANFGVLQALELMRVYCFGDAPYDLYLRFERPGTIRPKSEEWASNVCSDIALHRTRAR